MSSAELDLGAKLFVDAVDGGLPDLLTSDETSTEYRNLKLSFKDMQRQLIGGGFVRKDADKKWRIQDEAISAAGEDVHKKFLPYYETVVMAHEKASAQMIADGKADYVASFRELHSATIFDIEPETVTRVNGQDMQAIAGASLELLEAVRQDPANAAFVKGLDSEAKNDLWSVLEGMNYLMPGENPDRAAPIGEQTLRGTPEQQEALFHQAAALVSNFDIPEKIALGDRPMGAAVMLRNTVAQARMVEVHDNRLTNSSPDLYHDSDLHPDAANALFNVLTTGSRMVISAEYTSREGVLQAREDTVLDVKTALADYDALLVKDALEGKGFDAAGMDEKKGKLVAQSVEFLREAVTVSPDEMLYTGDDGGSLTEEGATVSAEIEEDLDLSDEMEGDAEDAVIMSADENTADAYGSVDPYVKLTQSLVDQFGNVAHDALMDGTMEKLRRNAGRAEVDLDEFVSANPAFADFESAMGANRIATTPELTSRVSEAMSANEFANMNPKQQKRLKVAWIDPKHEPFKGYVPGGPAVAKKRLTRWLDDHMVEDGKPNLNLRNWLKNAATMPIVGKTKEEAEAMRDYAHSFVAREAEEHRARREARNEKIGITTFDLPADQVKRAIDVASESKDGTDTKFRVGLAPSGKVTITHPDAPQMVSQLSEVPAELAKSEKSPRQFGGMLSLQQLKAGYETGAEQIQVSMLGESVHGVHGKVHAAERQVSRAKPKRKFEDLALS